MTLKIDLRVQGVLGSIHAERRRPGIAEFVELLVQPDKELVVAFLGSLSATELDWSAQVPFYYDFYDYLWFAGVDRCVLRCGIRS